GELAQDFDVGLLLRELRAQPLEPAELRIGGGNGEAFVESVHEAPNLLLVHRRKQRDCRTGFRAERLHDAVGDSHPRTEANRPEVPTAAAVPEPNGPCECRAQRSLCLLVGHPGDVDAGQGHAGLAQYRRGRIPAQSRREARRQYRKLLFTTDGAEKFIGGVILFDETIRQTTSDGTSFPKLLESKGIVPGIKVDKGAKPLALAEGETVTEGLDRLRERLAE